MKSNVRRATEDDIETALALHETGKCDHSIIYDEAGWLYDLRTCAICEEGLGTV